MLHAHRISLFAHSCTSLNLFAIRTRFTPSVRKSALPQGAREELSCAEHTVKNLSSNRPIILTTLKKAAFTLAEVLITLGIIGVVAALTLPTLIEHHKEKVILTKLSQTQSLLAQTFKLAQANDEDIFLLMSNNENGSGIPDSENLTNIANSANLANIFRKYTKLALDCGSVDEEHACTPTQK